MSRPTGPFCLWPRNIADPLWPDLDVRKRLLLARIEEFLDDVERPITAGECLHWLKGIRQPTVDEVSYVLRVMERCGYIEQIEVEETKTFIDGRTMTVVFRAWRIKTC